MKTKVIFKKIKWESNDTEIVAVFTEQLYNEELYKDLLLNCYSHIGQHSSIHRHFLTDGELDGHKIKTASKKEYLPLYNELLSIGYDLEIF